MTCVRTMGKEPASENGQLEVAESTEDLSPTIFQVLSNLMKNRFQVRLSKLSLDTSPAEKNQDEILG